jgi:uncharacterized protein (DUF924 family)
MNAKDVYQFWFQDLNPQQWFAKDADLDNTIRDRFLETYQQATRCELFSWRTTPQGRLSEILVLDQFSRNIFRDNAQAFKFDSLALCLAQEAVACGADKELFVQQRAFLYMPYMHSESLVIHAEAVQLFSQPGLEFNLDFEKKHLAILQQFGRYPHRNKVLERESTTEEIEFLNQPGSSF